MLLLYTTFGTKDEATDITRQLIEEDLIACANMVEMDSVYRWEGEVIEDEEVLALCKLPETNRDAVRDRLAEIHPYDVPCIVFYESLDALDAYADWVRG
jgi:periplasmic divalent cation tolerance protein